MIKLKSPRELNIMKEAGQIVARCHRYIRDILEPGLTTSELDEEVERIIRDHDSEPAFKDYRGFPASICTSINEEIVHGIPSDRTLEEGDILSIDIGVEYRNYFGDAARTHPVGEVTEKAVALLRDTREALDRAIERFQEGADLYDISRFIQEFGEGNGYGVVREYVGHGIGQEMHEDPQVPNFYDPDRHNKTVELKPGLVLAIEPMLNLGSRKTSKKDSWTVVTEDQELSAHMEDTVALTDEGLKIFTRFEDGSTFHDVVKN